MTHSIAKFLVLGSSLFLGMSADILATGGILDASFNGTGKSVFNIESSAVSGAFGDVVVIGGDKFLVAGSAATSGPSSYSITLSRFNSDGTLDTTFAAGGKMITNVGVTAQGVALGLQSDGKIIVAANGGNYPDRMTVVLRYSADGMLDTTFGTNGVFFSSVMKVASDVSVLADDKILIAGMSDVPNLGRTQVLKLTANGSPDTAFGTNGITSSTYTFGSSTDRMVVQSDGKIVVGGTNLFNVPKWLIHRFNTDGSPDTTFGTLGIKEINVSGSMHAGGLVLQPDGKIVISGSVSVSGGGSNSQLLLVRVDSGGNYDVTFGGGGFVFRDPTTDYDRSHHLTRASDGRLIIAGQYDDGQAMLASFDSTGAIDTTFGTDGLLLLPANSTSGIALQASNLVVIGQPISGMYISRVSMAGAIVSFRPESVVSGKNDVAYDVAIQPDGKIVSAGASVGGSGGSVVSVARQLPDGTLDPTFGTGGRVTFSDGTSFSFVAAVEVQQDGKIVVAGQGSQQTTFTYYSLIVARLNPNGSLDDTFGTGGKVIITNPRNLIGHDMKLQPDGKIVVAGRIERLVGDGIFEHDIIALRLSTNGTLDGGFGGGLFIYANGTATSPVYEQAKALSIQADGKIVLAGTHLLRLNPDSTIDGTFSPTPVPLNFTATDVEVQPDGKVVVSGSNGDFAITRFNSNATIDSNFGLNGTAYLDFGGNDIANAIYRDPNGDFVVGGSTLGGSSAYKKFALARLKPDGSPDPSFGSGGKVITDFGADAQIFGLARQSDGKIVAAGNAKLSIDSDYAVARYLSRSTPFDFDGDGKSDISIYRPSPGEWWILRSSDGGNRAAQFGGGATDKITPADFTGDGKTDIAFCRNGGEWFVLREDNTYYSHPFGLAGDIAVPADYDGDNIADEAVFRPSSSTWYVHKSGGGTIIEQFGTSGDAPVAADYDGDGKADLAIWRASVGQWWIKRSTLGVIAVTFGNGADKPVQGDYTGDGLADVAFWRPSTGEWFVLRSEDFSYFAAAFGTTGDIPAPGDYDGDGRFDRTVFRPSSSTWYSHRTTAGTLIQQFGVAGDRPVANAYVP